MNRLGFFGFLVVSVACCFSHAAHVESIGVGNADFSIIPLPAELEIDEGVFTIHEDTRIEIRGVNDLGRVRFFKDTIVTALLEISGVGLSVNDKASASGRIVLEQDRALMALGDEGYQLVVSPDFILIRSATEGGLFWGLQSLRQMLPFRSSGAATIACCRIEDIPQSGWRGYMLDVSRRFIPVAELKAHIDLLARYKINILHLHLTDDQGWRLQIEAYPKLTSVGAWRDGEEGELIGGFYTQSQMRELVDYAACRFITIVPEIDVPGHAQAALAAYPEYSCTGGPFKVRTTLTDPGDVALCPSNEATYVFLEKILDEVLSIFPSEYIHLGVDEVVVRRWKSCGDCQNKIATEGLMRAEDLQGYFAERMASYLALNNRKMICWDDLLEDQVPEGATIMFWRTWTGTERLRKAAEEGHDVILAPVSNYYFSGSPHLQYVYDYSKEKVGFSESLNDRIIGYQAALWTEHIHTRGELERYTFPRLFAFSEGAWTPPSTRSWTDFERRLWHHYALADVAGVNFAMPSPGGFSDRTLFQEEAEVVVVAPEHSIVYYTLDGGEPSPLSEIYRDPITLKEDAVFKARIFFPSGRVGPARTGLFKKAELIEPVMVEQPMGGVRYAYKEGQMFPEILVADMSTTRVGVIDRFRVPDDVRNDHFAVEFDAYLLIQESAEYVFHTISDDGSRLWVGDQLVVDNWGFRPSISRSGSIYLAAGYYPVRLEYLEATGDSLLKVSYGKVGAHAEEVRASDLFYPFDGGANIQTTMGQHDIHSIDGVLDGMKGTFYWSGRAPKKGDFIQINFEAPTDISSIDVLTGADDGRDSLVAGVLEASISGSEFWVVGEFSNGTLFSEVAIEHVRSLRIRVLENQRDWLQIRTININENDHTKTK